MSPNGCLRVLLLNEYFYPDNQGGTGTATSDIARRLTETHGAQVTAIASRFAYRDPSVVYKATEDWRGISIHRVPSPPWGRQRPIKRFVANVVFSMAVARKAIALPRHDVALVTTAPLTLPLAARMVLKLKRTPYAYLIYDLDPDRAVALHLKGEHSRSVRVVRGWQRRWLGSAERVVAIGRCMKDYVTTRYGLSDSKVSVVEVGADPDIVRPLPKSTKFRKDQHLNGFVVLYSGNFGYYHDFDTLLAAAETLQRCDPDVTFVMVGGGHKKGYVEDQVAVRGLRNVYLYPFVPEEEFSDLLASADMTVVTLESGMEGLCVPSKFYSFIAAGRPVVALMQKDTEVALAVQESSIGFQIEIGDVSALVKAIEVAKACPEQLDEMGCRARKVFDELYSADRVAAKMYDVLCECAKAAR